MKMRESTGIGVLIAALIFFSAVCPSSGKEVYKWVDEKGTVHFSEDESSVPEAYRGRVEKKPMPEEARPPEEKATPRKQDGKKAKDRPALKEKERVNRNRIEGDVVESLKTILSLWKNERYDLLYDWGDQKSRAAVNKENFEHRMRKKGTRLASSWGTIQAIQSMWRGPASAFPTEK